MLVRPDTAIHINCRLLTPALLSIAICAKVLLVRHDVSSNSSELFLPYDLIGVFLLDKLRCLVKAGPAVISLHHWITCERLHEVNLHMVFVLELFELCCLF